MVKSILKRYSRPATSRPENNTYTPEGVDSPKKRVSFDGPELVRVFEADEWDRTPAQVTLKLTYKLSVSVLSPHQVRFMSGMALTQLLYPFILRRICVY